MSKVFFDFYSSPFSTKMIQSLDDNDDGSNWSSSMKLSCQMVIDHYWTLSSSSLNSNWALQICCFVLFCSNFVIHNRKHLWNIIVFCCTESMSLLIGQQHQMTSIMMHSVCKKIWWGRKLNLKKREQNERMRIFLGVINQHHCWN